MKYLFILLMAFLLTNCKKENLLEPTGSVEFNNSLKGNYRYFGSFKEKEKTIIFFGDLLSEKKIYFHTENGKLIDSIVFNNKLLQDGDFDLNIISRDTFLLTDKKSIFALNKKNEIIKTVQIDSFLKNEPNIYHFQMSNKIHGQQLKNKILTGLDWRNGKKNEYKSIDDFRRLSFTSPNLLVISNLFTDNVSYKIHYKNYYQYFFDKPGSFTSKFYAYKINNKYIIPPSYSNKFIVFTNNLNSNTLKTLESDFCTSERNKPIVTGAINYKYPFVLNVLTSNISQNNYIILRHKIKDNIEKLRLSRPFSLITLDKDFKKIDEKVILDDSHTPHLSFNIDDRIYIKQNLKDESKNIFSIF